MSLTWSTPIGTCTICVQYYAPRIREYTHWVRDFKVMFGIASLHELFEEVLCQMSIFKQLNMLLQ